MQGVSQYYSFLPTIQAIQAMRDSGFVPVWVSEQHVRLEKRVGFQKHMIRFQHNSSLVTAPDFTPEIVLVNSHDRSSAYQLHAGIFRLVCGNGMIAADTTFDRIAIRHTGFDPGMVVDASRQIINALPQLTAEVESFRARRLTPAESKAFAESAILLKYDDIQTAPIGAEMILRPRRNEDAANDLWSTFNRIQENIIRGGQKDYTRRANTGHRARRSRGVSSIDENVRLNKSLWHLANALKQNSIGI
jgi:hypothetical protein